MTNSFYGNELFEVRIIPATAWISKWRFFLLQDTLSSCFRSTRSLFYVQVLFVSQMHLVHIIRSRIMAGIRFITLRKQVFICIISVISLAIFFETRTQLFRECLRLLQQRSILREVSPRSSLPSIYGKRARQVSEGCMHVSLALKKNRTLTFSNTIDPTQHNLDIFFTLRSYSLMYCATAKVATTTLRSIMIYVHLKEIYNHVTGHRIETDFIGIPWAKLANVPALIRTLREVKWPMIRTQFDEKK